MSFLCLAPGKHCIAALQYVHLPVQVNFLEGVVSRSLSVMSPGPAQRAMPGSLYPLFTQSDSHCMWQSQYRGLAPRALPADWTKSETAEEITGSIWIMVVTVSLVGFLKVSTYFRVKDHEAFGSGSVWFLTLIHPFLVTSGFKNPSWWQPQPSAAKPKGDVMVATPYFI